jgi:hypothetical protein
MRTQKYEEMSSWVLLGIGAEEELDIGWFCLGLDL